MEDLCQAILHVSADPRLRVLVIRGQGDEAFVAGADVHEMVDLDEDGATAFITRLYNLLRGRAEMSGSGDRTAVRLLPGWRPSIGGVLRYPARG
jgi:hypothetical protein